MLAKKERIPKHAFREFSRPSKIFRGEYLTARVFAGANLLKLKFSVSVSKKVEKKAVLRNKMRRIAYDTIRASKILLPKPFFVHFVFNSKPADLKTIPTEIEDLLQKI